MQALKRVLYAQAAAWGLAGAVLAVAPRFVTVTLFGGPGKTTVASADPDLSDSQ